jgi:uncharacterized membrane protein YjjP (DUF1212 family)
MVRLLTLIFLSLLLFSCSTKKVAITKSLIKNKIDSVVVEKKENLSVTQNAISIKEDIDEIEIVPVDVSKPIVIGGKEYFNAAVRIKKTKKEVVDNTKSVVSQIENRTIEVKKEETRKELDKKVEKTSPSFIWFWVVLIAVASAFIAIRYVLK